MDSLRAWHVYDIAAQQTTVTHVEWALLVAEAHARSEVNVNGITNVDVLNLRAKRSSMKRLTMLYLGRAIVVRSNTSRTKSPGKLFSTGDMVTTRGMMERLMESTEEVDLLAVIPPDLEAPIMRQRTVATFNECVTHLNNLHTARRSGASRKVDITRALNALFTPNPEAPYRIVVLSKFDALMPCASMPTAPMQFDMGVV